MTTINNILGTFAPITLEQMSSVKLMNRTDTKFVTNMAKLRLLLHQHLLILLLLLRIRRIPLR